MEEQVPFLVQTLSSQQVRHPDRVTMTFHVDYFPVENKTRE